MVYLNFSEGGRALRIAVGIIGIIMLGLLLAGSAQAATLTVCKSGCAYSSIQTAVNAASSGDTILVQSSTYYENVNVNKQLTLRGIGMPVVDANGSGSAITLSADGITLDEFIVTGSGDSPEAGIMVASSNNTLIGNIASNNYYGIYLIYSSNNNKIYHNNLRNNTKQAIDNTNANSWNSDSSTGGNYWSDYTGIDLESGLNQDQPGSDGIGDTPYTISDGNSMDRYPLMIPFSGGIKGDLNNNGIPADAGDLVLMKRASTSEISADSSYDLNNNGIPADASDLVLMKRISIGEIQFQPWPYYNSMERNSNGDLLLNTEKSVWDFTNGSAYPYMFGTTVDDNYTRWLSDGRAGKLSYINNGSKRGMMMITPRYKIVFFNNDSTLGTFPSETSGYVSIAKNNVPSNVLSLLGILKVVNPHGTSDIAFGRTGYGSEYNFLTTNTITSQETRFAFIPQSDTAGYTYYHNFGRVDDVNAWYFGYVVPSSIDDDYWHVLVNTPTVPLIADLPSGTGDTWKTFNISEYTDGVVDGMYIYITTVGNMKFRANGSNDTGISVGLPNSSYGYGETVFILPVGNNNSFDFKSDSSAAIQIRLLGYFKRTDSIVTSMFPYGSGYGQQNQVPLDTTFRTYKGYNYTYPYYENEGNNHTSLWNVSDYVWFSFHGWEPGRGKERYRTTGYSDIGYFVNYIDTCGNAPMLKPLVNGQLDYKAGPFKATQWAAIYTGFIVNDTSRRQTIIGNDNRIVSIVIGINDSTAKSGLAFGIQNYDKYYASIVNVSNKSLEILLNGIVIASTNLSRTIVVGDKINVSVNWNGGLISTTAATNNTIDTLNVTNTTYSTGMFGLFADNSTDAFNLTVFNNNVSH